MRFWARTRTRAPDRLRFLPKRAARDGSRLAPVTLVFRDLLDHAHDVIFRYRVHPAAGFEYINPAAARILGYTPEEHYADPRLVRKIVHPDDRARLDDALARLAAGRNLDGAMEMRYVHRNGSIVWMETRVFAERDEPGTLVAIEGVARDITGRLGVEWKRAEDASRESARHFRSLIENATDVVATVDVKGVITYQSPATPRIMGYAPEEIVGRDAFELLHPDDRDRVRAAFARGVSLCEPQRIEYRYLHKDGGYRWLESYGRPMFDETGSVIGAIINSRDVTERREAMNAIEQANAYRKAVENGVRVGLVITDSEGRLAYANRALYQMTGYDERELVGLTAPFPYWCPEDRDARLAWFTRLLRGEVEPQGYETQVLRRSGDRFDAFVQPSPVQLPDGTQGWLASFEDITHRKRLEAEFRQAQKMEAIGRLAGGVAHDFNNLLTAIVGYTELALEGIGDGDPLRDDLSEIRKAGESAASLTRQLLAFSRHQVLQPVVLSLNTVVSEMTKMLARVIGEDVVLVTALDPGLKPTRADRGQIEQVIMNLAVNARDAMPSGGRLVIQTANRTLHDPGGAGLPELTPGEYVVLAVSDTGQGMDAQVRSHLFEPFFTTKERGRGTGLGLATIYGIIKQSAGHIVVDTRAGRGSSFVVFLPVSTATDEAQSAPAGAAGVAHARGERILVVEDNDAIRALAQQVLEQAGYAVRAARTAEEAIGMLEMGAFAIDLLVTDVVMPGLSGPALAAHLRERMPTLRCIFMSGYAEDALKEHGAQGHEPSFLPKPFRPSVLLQKVREQLDQYA